MGSLWGHIDGGISFIVLGFWWMYNVMKEYLQAGGAARYKTQVSYTASLRGRTFNWEVYAKIIAPTIGFLIDFFNRGSHIGILDKDGSFDGGRISSVQHMSIYAFFSLHGVVDLLRYKEILVLEASEYLTLSSAFAWYGMVFYFHNQSGHADKLETVVHYLGMVWCFSASVSVFWECRSKDKFLPNFCRSLMVICLGTWFTHIPFYLYPNSFPGDGPNPNWDRNDIRNAQMIATLFGFHLMFNISLSLGLFAVMKVINRITHGGTYRAKFQLLSQNITYCDDKGDTESLLDNEL